MFCRQHKQRTLSCQFNLHDAVWSSILADKVNSGQVQDKQQKYFGKTTHCWWSSWWITNYVVSSKLLLHQATPLLLFCIIYIILEKMAHCAREDNKRKPGSAGISWLYFHCLYFVPDVQQTQWNVKIRTRFSKYGSSDCFARVLYYFAWICLESFTFLFSHLFNGVAVTGEFFFNASFGSNKKLKARFSIEAFALCHSLSLIGRQQ